ncbi:MAG: Nicotinamide-nucleotide amidohydrolase PncC [Chlamydiae bacterium]|nr:Nicotinamide-nucleotide amidohydrolase PncC [Chlamydiota bacterium]
MSQIENLHNSLIEKGKTLALAESCTGGCLAAKLTAIPNASKYFLGCIVAYSNAMKRKLLNVSQKTLLESGAISRETANEMLIGLMKVSEADFGIAITGDAGPTGNKIGTVYIAVGAHGKKPHVIECHFKGDRKAVMEAACDRALECVCEFI